jgi:hypothetical protein
MGKQHRLNTKNAVYTAQSGTTRMINYDPAKQVLEVQFIEGDVYHYQHVPKKLWEEYLNIVQSGGSSGTFVNKVIKPYYTFKKVSQ